MPVRHVDFEEFEKAEAEARVPKTVPAWLFVVTVTIGIVFITCLVLLSVLLGKQNTETVEDIVAEAERTEDLLEIEIAEINEIPVAYSTFNRESGQYEVKVVDRETLEETVVYSHERRFELFAVPQIGFDNRVILREFTGAGQDIVFSMLDVKTGEWSKMDIRVELPGNISAIELAPDQVHVIAVYDEDYAVGETPKDVVMWNLLESSRDLVGVIGDEEFFHSNGQFDISWTSQTCAEVGIYTNVTLDDQSIIRRLTEYRTFCQ